MTGNWFGLAAMAAVWRGMLTALVILWATAALGQNSLQGLSAAMQGGQEMVTLDLAQGLSELPSGFVLQSPARIALDLPGMLNQAGRSSFEFRLGRLKSASLVQSGERLRLVLVTGVANCLAPLDVTTLDPVDVLVGATHYQNIFHGCALASA